MLESFRNLLESLFGESPANAEDARAHGLELATAALLVEMARADFEAGGVERRRIFDLLQARFRLDDAETRALLELAAEKTDASASLHEFTHVLHQRLREAEKSRLLEMLWEVALADRRIDRHEEALMRKIGDLLYVPNIEQARIRHASLESVDR
ncbi:MAG: TerB family tellurite resistance protein [Gammaproteobacteria bacterium]